MVKACLLRRGGGGGGTYSQRPYTSTTAHSKSLDMKLHPDGTSFTGLFSPHVHGQACAYLQGEAGRLDLFLAGHEDEDVPLRMSQVYCNGLLHSCIHVVLLRRLGEHGLHREGAPRNAEHRDASKEVSELVGVQRCRGHNELEVPPSGNDLPTACAGQKTCNPKHQLLKD